MGTRGKFAIRYKSRYYVVFNQYDSYFEGLGYNLIKAIRSMSRDQWDELKAKLLSFRVNPQDEDDDEVETIKNENIIMSVPNYGSDLEVVTKEPELDTFIEYVYILDLDVDVFTAISRHHKDEDAPYEEMRYTCRFENLSKEWLDSLESW